MDSVSSLLDGGNDYNLFATFVNCNEIASFKVQRGEPEQIFRMDSLKGADRPL